MLGSYDTQFSIKSSTRTGDQSVTSLTGIPNMNRPVKAGQEFVACVLYQSVAYVSIRTHRYASSRKEQVMSDLEADWHQQSVFGDSP